MTDSVPASSSAPVVGGPSDSDRHVAEIAERGFTVLPDVLDPDQVAALVEDLGRIEAQEQIRAAGNGFEGTATLRAYNLLRHGPLWEAIPVHPDVLAVVDGVLGRGCLVSSLSSIRIMPGETAQPIHADDQLIPLTQPHPPVVCNTMWALTDFTDANGATRLVPGSHLKDSPEFGGDYPTVAAEMSAGDVLVWHGSLWHGGGANTTDADRIGIAMNYCAGWVRQQENQQLVGYGVYFGLIGHIERRSPADAILGTDRGMSMVWEAT